MNHFDLDTLMRPVVKTLTPYTSARDEFQETTSDMVFLDANENPFNNGLNRYPDPQQQDLKTVLATMHASNPKNILLGNGSDEVLDLIFRAFCEPRKDSIMTLPPTYGMYQVLAQINDVENKEIRLDKNFQPNVDAILEELAPNVKLIFICSPNNPTGNLFAVEKIEKILSLHNGLVIIDEAYIDFSNTPSWTERLSEFPNLIVTQTLSKAYAMAGIRLGICYASEAIIRILNRIKPPYNINVLTQKTALKILSQTHVKQDVIEILEARKMLISTLKTIDFVSKIHPSDANFVLVRVDAATKRYEQLIAQGIVVRNRTHAPGCENCLRLTIGTPSENQKLINALKAIDQP